MNRFIKSLTRACEDHLLEEKLLIAPSLRIGHQWAELAARQGRGILNLKPTTMMGLAMKVAGARIAGEGSKVITAKDMQILISESASRAFREGAGYFSSLKPGIGLMGSLAKAISDLRLASLTYQCLNADYFASAGKGKEVISLLREYTSLLEKYNLVDYADILHLAVSILTKDLPQNRDRTIIFLPEDVETSTLEADVLQSIARNRKVLLPCDNPEPLYGQDSDQSRKPSGITWEVPGNSTADQDPVRLTIFKAVGEVNEVRGVLRRCLVANLPFDGVEIIHTDTNTYVPLVFETVAQHIAEGADLDSLPVTFAEGIPAGMSRPGRALSSMIRWSINGWSVSSVARMLTDGLLKVKDNPRNIPFSKLSALLRRLVPVGGKDAAVSILDRQISTLGNRLKTLQEDEGEEMIIRNLEDDLEGSLILRGLIQDLLDIIPDRWGDPAVTLKSAEAFLNDFARSADTLDGYGKKHLLEEIREMAKWHEMFSESRVIDIPQWLAGLPENVRIAGSGPMPGRIHVAHISGGGHSGRKNTYIVGLDEGRFPGAGLQDPVLLDSERRALSKELSVSHDLSSVKIREFYRLLSRLRGCVTMSFSARDLTGGRDMLPSPIVLSVYRKLVDPEVDLTGMLKDLEQVSFVPEETAGATDRDEWLLSSLLGKGKIKNPDSFLSGIFPHLAQGELARTCRMSPTATSWDGLLTRSGPELDPTGPEGPVMSATRFETLGACPLRYFFRYVLEIKPPDEEEPDRSVWLSNMDYGSLLHTVFHRFMEGLVSEGLCPDFIRDEGRLMQILEEEISAKGKTHPPPTENSLERDRQRLREASRLFLREEERFCRIHEPLFMEASIGIPGSGTPTPVDSHDPVYLDLPDGRSFRARGRLDRIDRARTSESDRFVVTDYKSGSDRKYRYADPFWQGRVIQHALYLALAGHRLAETMSPSASVSSFRFLFLSENVRSESMFLMPEDLSRSGELFSHLCDIAASGTFFPSTDKNSCEYCDYLGSLCESDPGVNASLAKSKFNNLENARLDPIRGMREKKR